MSLLESYVDVLSVFQLMDCPPLKDTKFIIEIQYANRKILCSTVMI